MRWTDICGRVSGDLDTGPVVQIILKALQLPEESTFEELRAFDGKLVCLCGHPSHRQPKNFVALVSHILAENRWYKQRFGSSNEPRYSSDEWEKHDIVLYNDHHPTGESLVGVASDLDPRIFKVAPVEDGRGTDEVLNHGIPLSGNKYCKYCFALGELALLNCKYMLNYHMKAKHRREHTVDDDALSSWDLAPWKLKALPFNEKKDAILP
ncbi:hypothetical protein FIBSPDRAFT_952413 [Athelia psychrophila]|uniref:Uncharacterized protein n=1 Tax=Athelia psychrophila TaxID=1759441 RepID=A0A166LDN1_9AGAM|nr:hypothetical protein FIBSPDRAFT_952413 [Fibularhizoctonia sp. CBS 109695]